MNGLRESVTISVVIPAFNEAAVLAGHLARLQPVLDEVAPGCWEIIVVDDGSTDGTAAVVEGLGGAPQVRVLIAPVNRGKGAAIRRGVAATQGELVLTCDADMSTPPELLPAFVAALGAGADIVIGNRRSPAATIERPQPWRRRVLGMTFLRLCQLLTRVNIQDFNCGFKLFRGQVARQIMAAATIDGWSIDMESLALAKKFNYRIAELPVVWCDSPRSAVRLARDIPATLREMLRVWWRLRRMRPAPAAETTAAEGDATKGGPVR